MHHLSSPEADGPSEEDPQPAEPSPLHIILSSQLHHESKHIGDSSVHRLIKEVRVRPDDCLSNLEDTEELFLLAGLIRSERPHHPDDDDTYSEVSLEVSYRTWRVKVENVSGSARVLMYDLDRPRHIEIYDGASDEDTGIYISHHRTHRELTPEDTEILQHEVLRMVEWFGMPAQYPPEQDQGSQEEPAPQPIQEVSKLSRTSLLRRLGSLPLLRLR